MKTVFLCNGSPIARHIVHELKSIVDLDLVVIESPQRRLLVSDFKKYGSLDTLSRVGDVTRRLLNKKIIEANIDKQIGSNWRDWPSETKLHETDDINATEVGKEIAARSPDLILCWGTTMVRSATLGDISRSLNVHTGLSPYYCGSRCLEWALILGDVNNIGVTVHQLTTKIDGGAIFGQATIPVSPEDTVYDLHLRLDVQGAKILLDAVRRLARGEDISLHPQPSDEGLMLYRRQWSRHTARQLNQLMKRGDLARMCKNPSSPQKHLIAPWSAS